MEEHRKFKNQMIIITVICFGASWFMRQMIIFGIMFGLISLFNIYTYKKNIKDYTKTGWN